MNMEKPLTQESMRMKGSSLSFQQKQLMSKPLTEAHPPQVYLSHTTFFTLSSLFSPPLDFCSDTPSSPLYKHNKKDQSDPYTSTSSPLCGKWRLCRVPVHNTVSTASASDWFTASRARCSLNGAAGIHTRFDEDRSATNTQQRYLRMTHFH